MKLKMYGFWRVFRKGRHWRIDREETEGGAAEVDEDRLARARHEPMIRFYPRVEFKALERVSNACANL